MEHFTCLLTVLKISEKRDKRLKRWVIISTYKKNWDPVPTVFLFPPAMDNCFVCKQSWPYCCQPLLQLRDKGHHVMFLHPIKSTLKEVWGLGSVGVTCCGTYYGKFLDDETTTYYLMYLGNSEHEALARLYHMKSFLLLKKSLGGKRSLRPTCNIRTL